MYIVATQLKTFTPVGMAISIVVGERSFDPFPFILLNLVLSCLAAIQAPSSNFVAYSRLFERMSRRLGAEIRLEAPVGRILVRDGRATGVALESGEEILADAVLSSVDSKRTFIDLLEPGTLDPAFDEPTVRQLVKLGYKLKRLDGDYGNMQAVVWDKNAKRLDAASDPRLILRALACCSCPFLSSPGYTL